MGDETQLIELSIIIPALNEGGKIAADILAADEFLTSNNLSGEIIVIDDGSSDNTSEVAQHTSESLQSKFHIYSNKSNRGKGFSVRRGVAKSTGEFVMFADSGVNTPFRFALDGLELIKSGQCDFAHASRKLRESNIIKPQSIQRKISAKIFRILAKLLLDVPFNLTDTQCGFKVYKGDIAREVYCCTVFDGFMFDLEMIFLAHEMGCKIMEFPIEWTCDPDSRLSISKTTGEVIYEFFLLRKRFR